MPSPIQSMRDEWMDAVERVRSFIFNNLNDPAEDVRSHIRRRVVIQKRDKNGQTFPSYAESTAKRKGVSGPAFLVQSGRLLLNSLRIRRRHNKGERVEEVYSDAQIFPHGMILQDGFPHAKSGKPVGPFLWFGVTPSAQRRIADKYLARAIEQRETPGRTKQKVVVKIPF